MPDDPFRLLALIRERAEIREASSGQSIKGKCQKRVCPECGGRKTCWYKVGRGGWIEMLGRCLTCYGTGEVEDDAY